MMAKATVVSVALIWLLAGAPASAEEPTWLADVGVTGLIVNVRGNEAKFNEYRDLRDGAYGRGQFLYDTDAWFLKGEGKDFGFDTQSYRLDGGLWGIFRADAFYRELPHNITFGAKSMFSDVGNGHLVLPTSVNPNDFSTWASSFDYSTKRREAGGSFSLDRLKPYFFTLSGQSEQRKGIKPAGVSLEMDDLFALELPEPIRYQTDTIKADLGYAGKRLFLDLNVTYSHFRNSNAVLGFPNIFDQGTGAIITPGAAATPDALTLPPSNNYYKVGFKGSTALPWHSKLNVNAGWSRTTSNATLLSTNVLDAIAPAPSLLMSLSQRVFHGEVDTQNADVILTTNPVDFLDGKIFYKFYNRDNRSDRVTQTDDAGETLVNRLFSYQKNEVGGEVGFWLPQRLHLTTGYQHVITDRRHQDAAQHNAITADTIDDIASAELRWKGLDFATVRAGYEHLVRNSTLQRAPEPDGAPVFGARNFDIAPQIRDRLKVGVDLDPIDPLSIGLEFRHTEINYRDLTFGLKHDRREEVLASADLSLTKYAQLFASFDYQWVTRTQQQQDQSVSDAARWKLEERERYYDLTGGANIVFIPKKLLLRLQYSYARSEGRGDLTLSDDALNNPASALAGTGANNLNIDIPRRDNYSKQSVGAELIYSVTNYLSLAIGYAYERFKYSDTQLDGYLPIVPTTGADHNGAFLTGANARPSYNANSVFARLTYRFQ